MNKLFLKDEFTDSELRELENSRDHPPWFYPAHFWEKLFCVFAFKVSRNHYQITGIWLSWANSKWNPSVLSWEQGRDVQSYQEWWRENSHSGAETVEWNPQHKNAWGFFVPSLLIQEKEKWMPTELPSSPSQGFNRLKWKFQGKYHHQRKLLGGTE